MGRPVNPLWREKVLEACSRKNMTLLEPVGTPAMFSELLISCEHHPEGRNVLVKSIINSIICDTSWPQAHASLRGPWLA